MSNESTTSSLDDVTNASLVIPYMIGALSEQPGLYRVAKEFDIRNLPTKAAKIPSETSWWGSANDDGAGVDTEFDATEATTVSNTQVSTGGITITTAEYAVAIEPTDNVEEDSVNGLDLLMRFRSRMLMVISLAMEDDFLALLASLSNVTGVSTADLTVAQLLSAITNLRVRGVVCDSLVGILDNQQASDLQSALISTNTSIATWAPAADRIISWNPSADRGFINRMIGSFANVPMFATGLTDTANTGADVAGGILTPSSAFNDGQGFTTYGAAWKRLPTFEMQRQAKMRATDLVMSARWGCAEMLDGSGEAVITDAP
jgi:hypothetical protein